ncbi:MAG: PP2C family protein-serine/threonine phosphatase [Halothece sp.]
MKRYLLVVGTPLEDGVIGKLIADRYRVVSPTWVLETHPEKPPILPETIPSWLKPYLKLSPYRQHIPKVYGYLPHGNEERWLLEYEPLASRIQEKLEQGQFLCKLEEVWQGTPAIRQLNWLLQISQLWQPLQVQGVVKTLINPELVRVNGPIIQLQQLEPDKTEITLKDLGNLWSNWQETAHPEIRLFFQQVCQQLQKGEFRDSESLSQQLEKGIAQIARSRQYKYHIATASEAGPSRQQNEDAYYDTETESQKPSQALAMVCDGVGGHQGGEVASKLAVEQVRQYLNGQKPASPEAIITKIENAVSVANDVISDQNDTEHRYGQQRMGTTLVMALADHHEMYLTHVGDSRIYWITYGGCYQLTLDDDLASRQTRLGHMLYREALQQPYAGALVQALGMSSSQLLHPTTQRLMIDEESVFLLCSDGLSDNDLVESYWEEEILPILTEGKDLKQVTQRLINLANRLNGHDNVTVSLVKCSVSASGEDPTQLKADQKEASSQPTLPVTAPAKTKKKAGFPWLLLLMGLVMGGLGVAYWELAQVHQSLQEWQENWKPMETPSE